MVNAFLDGVRDAGATGEQILLAHQHIAPCTACKACWSLSNSPCVQHDAMDDILPKVLSADVFGVATPIYVDNMTGLMKTFLDRLAPLADPRWELDEHGECRHRQKFPNPTKLVGIANCGFPEQSHFQVLALALRRMARNLHCDLVAEIYRGAGGLLTRTDPPIRPHIEAYLQCVRQAGREVVEHGELSDATRAELDRPLLPMANFSQAYMHRVNAVWGDDGA